MRRTKLEYYAMLKDVYTKKEFESEIMSRLERYAGLFSEDAVAAMMAAEASCFHEVVCRISEIKAGDEVTLLAKAVRVYQPRSFKNKNGVDSSVANIDVSDESGACRLVLWSDHDIDLIKNGAVKEGALLKIVNGRVKESQYGKEISIGKWSSVSLAEGALAREEGGGKGASAGAQSAQGEGAMASPNHGMARFSQISDLRPLGEANVRGVVMDVTSMRAFQRKDSTTGYVMNVSIYDGFTQASVVLWDENAKSHQDISVGDELEIRGGVAKEVRGSIEVHSRYSSSIKVNKAEGKK